MYCILKMIHIIYGLILELKALRCDFLSSAAEALTKYPLVMTNIAIENGPFIVDIPNKHGDFP